MKTLPGLPCVHMNGTSETDLVAMRCIVYEKLGTAYDALKHMAPHMRDYYVYPNGEAEAKYSEALEIHRARLKAIDDMRDSISAEAEAIQKFSL